MNRNEPAASTLPSCLMSATPSTRTSAESLVSAMKSFPSGGRIVRRAYGKTIGLKRRHDDRPSASAAST